MQCQSCLARVAMAARYRSAKNGDSVLMVAQTWDGALRLAAIKLQHNIGQPMQMLYGKPLRRVIHGLDRGTQVGLVAVASSRRSVFSPDLRTRSWPALLHARLPAPWVPVKRRLRKMWPRANGGIGFLWRCGNYPGRPFLGV